MKDQSAFDEEAPMLLGRMSDLNKPVVMTSRLTVFDEEEQSLVASSGPALKKAYQDKTTVEMQLKRYAEEAKKGASEDPSVTKIKNDLKKKLIELTNIFKEEKKKAIATQKELERK